MGGGAFDCFRIDFRGFAPFADGDRLRIDELGELCCPAGVILWKRGFGEKSTRREPVPEADLSCEDEGVVWDTAWPDAVPSIARISDSFPVDRKSMASSKASEISLGGVGGLVGRSSNTECEEDSIAHASVHTNANMLIKIHALW